MIELGERNEDGVRKRGFLFEKRREIEDEEKMGDVAESLCLVRFRSSGNKGRRRRCRGRGRRRRGPERRHHVLGRRRRGRDRRRRGHRLGRRHRARRQSRQRSLLVLFRMCVLFFMFETQNDV